MITMPNENTWKWIEQHSDDDITRLRLNARKNNGEAMDFAILQIECRRKAARKLTETLQNKRFIFPTALSAEQCTSDRLARFHASLIQENCNILDMTAGLGIDVFHIASKAHKVTAIDIVPEIADALAVNAATLKFDNIIAINTDSCDYLSNTTSHYDIIFIDPARRGDGGKRLYALSDCSPSVISLYDTIKSKCDKLIIKASPMLDVYQTIKELPGVSDIYAIGTPQECKELVAVIDFKRENSTTPTLHCVTLFPDKENIFSFTHEAEKSSFSTFRLPKEGDLIYEPYPAVMKMQPLKLLSQAIGVDKIHQNTHLYVSNKPITCFPGECYEIERIYDFSSKQIKEIAKDYPKASVATKNFILTAEELRRRLKTKESDTHRLIGITASDNNRYLIVTKRQQPTTTQ